MRVFCSGGRSAALPAILRAMVRRALLLSLVIAMGCSRTSDKPQPKAVAEPSAVDASVTAPLPDAGMKTEAPIDTPFSIIVRSHTAQPAPLARGLGSAMPLVQRLPNGGLLVASEHARARADGPGPLSVELLGRGALELDVLYRPAIVPGVQAMRWVWSDASVAIAVLEEETGRTGPRLSSYKLGANGFEAIRGAVGYFSAGMRGTSVLALERTVYEIPNSSIYPKGSGYEQNDRSLKPARVAVLAGPGPAPVIPPKVCPTAMGIGPDGAVAITIEKCGDAEGAIGVLRYAPGATTTTAEWFEKRPRNGEFPDEPAIAVASANEIYVADGDRLHTWNGKEWKSETPFDKAVILSVSRSPKGELWAVADDRVMKRPLDKEAWSEVKLPLAPADRLDAELYSAPELSVSDHFLKTNALPEQQAVRAESTAAMSPRMVDAAGDDVLVLAHVEREAFVLSTKPRGTVARIPSLSVQRARIAQALKRRVATGPKDCVTSFLVFGEGTTAEALKAALGGPSDGGASLNVGEATVEGQKRIVVYGEQEPTLAAMKKLATFTPKRLCGTAVVERPL